MPDQEVSEPEDGAGHSLKETSSNNIHLPRLERGYTQAQLPHALDSNSRAIHLCMTTTVNWEYRLRPLRTSSAMVARSYDVYFRNCLRNNFRRELHRLSPPDRMAGPPRFPSAPNQDRLTLWLLGMRDRQSTQGSTQVRTVQTGDVPTILEQTQIHAFLVQRMYEGFSAGVRPLPF
jgi:hypothetical protein